MRMSSLFISWFTTVDPEIFVLVEYVTDDTMIYAAEIPVQERT